MRLDLQVTQLHYLRNIMLLFALFFSINMLQAQNTEEYWLEALKNNPEIVHDSIYLELFKVTRRVDLERAKHYAIMATEFSEKNKNGLLFLRSANATGFVFQRLNVFDSAAIYYYKALDVCLKEGHTDRLHLIYNDLGSLYERLDRYDSALYFLNLSYEAAVATNKFEDQSNAKNNIGLIFYHINSYEEALSNLVQAKDIRLNNNITFDIEQNYLNIAIVLNDMGRYKEALINLEKVREFCGNGCSSKILAGLYYGLGYSKFKQDIKQEAYEEFVKAEKYAREIGSKETIANTLYHLALYSLEAKNFVDAKDKLMEVEDLTADLNLYRLQKDVYYYLSLVYENLNDLGNVVYYKDKYIALKDSLFNEKLANNVREIEIQAAKRESDQIIYQKDLELKRSRTILALSVGIALLLVAVIVLIYRALAFNRNLKNILKRQVELRTNELQASYEEIQKSYHEYDYLVYRTAHDIKGPLATLIGLTEIARYDKADAGKLYDYIEKIRDTSFRLDNTLSQLSEINQLRNKPIDPEYIELKTMIREVRESMSHLSQFPLIKFKMQDTSSKAILITDRRLLKFVITHCLHNAYQYFVPSKKNKYIKVSWENDERYLTIIIEDNGEGISKEAAEHVFKMFYVATNHHGSGLGLFLAQMAANRLGGRVYLARSENPTVFKITILNDMVKNSSLIISNPHIDALIRNSRF